MDKEKILKELKENTNKIDCGNEWENITVNLWEKYGKERIYINFSYGRYGKWTRGGKWMIDLQKENLRLQTVAKNYLNAHERDTLEEAVEKVLTKINK